MVCLVVVLGCVVVVLGVAVVLKLVVVLGNSLGLSVVLIILGGSVLNVNVTVDLSVVDFWVVGVVNHVDAILVFDNNSF